MKLNGKKFFERVYLIVGSFVVLMVVVIVMINFFRDGRLFAKASPPPTAAVPTATTKPTVTPTGTPKSDGLYIYKRAQDLIAKPKVDHGEATPTPSKEESALPPPKTSVEIVNYTQNKKLAEEIRATFEAAGFEVSAGNASTIKLIKTEIIERNDSKKGQEVKNILKAGIIRKEVDPNSRFDVTIILGDDFLP